jgi:carboxyl-terminal processing protease
MKRCAVLIVLMSLCAACSAIVGPDLSTSGPALFDRVWNDFDQHYSLFVVKQINWDSLRAVYRPLAVAAPDDDDVANTITDMLSNLRDGHVTFMGNAVGVAVHGNGYVPTITYGKYVVNGGAFPSGISYGTVSSTIGYIQIPTFEGGGVLPDLDNVLAALGGVTSVIVDIRNNDGGLLENATGTAARFAEQAMTVAFVRYRDGPAHTDFTAPIAQTVTPNGSHRFTGKVILLTSRNTVSAAELLVLSLRALGHTTVVGDTTAGETGSPFARELQNGWTYQFPESIEYTLAGNTFEDIGLAPDVAVRNTGPQIAANVDAQLVRAIALAGVH